MSGDRTIQLGVFWDRIRARGRVVAAIVITATLVTGVIAFLLPPWYRSVASLLPPNEEESSFGLASLLKGIGVPGVKVPTQAAPADVFVAVLQSRRINEEIVERFQLRERYHRRYLEDALKELRRHVAFSVNEAGMISIAVEDRDPKRAAEMAGAYVSILDRFNREVRMTKGRRTRLFVEKRLTETQKELRLAEAELADYQSRKGTLAISPEMSSGIETAARLYAERSALQVRLGVAESYSRGASPETAPLREQLAQIDRQLRALPNIGLESARMLREVKTLEALYVLLTSQHEEARITEARDVSTVEVLDVASFPERKSRPRRGVMIVTAFAISAAIAAGWAISQEDGRVLGHGRPE